MSESESAGELTDEAIAAATREYYDARPIAGDSWDAEPAGDLSDVTAEKLRLERALHDSVQGRQVLEVACGTGTMTCVAARAAKGIVAVDSSETCIRLARERCSMPRVEFRVADAFGLAALDGEFSGGFACGFFHLVPKRRHREFLDAFHSRLAPGSTVLLSASRTRTARAIRRQFRVPGRPDSLSKRQLSDGRSFVIVNNDFDADELWRLFGPVGRNLRVEVGEAWWWVMYSV